MMDEPCLFFLGKLANGQDFFRLASKMNSDMCQSSLFDLKNGKRAVQVHRASAHGGVRLEGGRAGGAAADNMPKLHLSAR